MNILAGYKPTVFVCYRQNDTEFEVTAIHEHLSARFGRRRVFWDVDIVQGRDFRQQIDDEIKKCDVCLVVIGPNWLRPEAESGDTVDYVRIEIETALRRGIPIIPVLVRRRDCPSAEELPESIRQLAYQHASIVRARADFRDDIEELVRSIRNVVSRQPRDFPWWSVAVMAVAWSFSLLLISNLWETRESTGFSNQQVAITVPVVGTILVASVLGFLLHRIGLIRSWAWVGFIVLGWIAAYWLSNEVWEILNRQFGPFEGVESSVSHAVCELVRGGVSGLVAGLALARHCVRRQAATVAVTTGIWAGVLAFAPVFVLPLHVAPDGVASVPIPWGLVEAVVLGMISGGVGSWLMFLWIWNNHSAAADPAPAAC